MALQRQYNNGNGLQLYITINHQRLAYRTMKLIGVALQWPRRNKQSRTVYRPSARILGSPWLKKYRGAAKAQENTAKAALKRIGINPGISMA